MQWVKYPDHFIVDKVSLTVAPVPLVLASTTVVNGALLMLFVDVGIVR